jgi:hypothetical protein
VAKQPLLTTRTLEAVQRLQNLFAQTAGDRVIDLDEQRAIRRELAIVEGEARHADNCGRYAMAVLRGVETVAYLDGLHLSANLAPEPLDAA